MVAQIDQGALPRDARGNPVTPGFMRLVDAQGNDQVGAKQETLQLAANVTTAGNYPASGISAFGGDYAARVIATSWTGVTAKLQFLDADGTSWTDIVKVDGSALTFSANQTVFLGLGSNATLRLVVAGSPTALYASLSRLP